MLLGRAENDAQTQIVLVHVLQSRFKPAPEIFWQLVDIAEDPQYVCLLHVRLAVASIISIMREEIIFLSIVVVLLQIDVVLLCFDRTQVSIQVIHKCFEFWVGLDLGQVLVHDEEEEHWALVEVVCDLLHEAWLADMLVTFDMQNRNGVLLVSQLTYGFM